MSGKKITIHAPGTIANLVCGFDIIGLALEKPYDIMTLEIAENPGLEIIHTDSFGLPIAPEQNVSGAALIAMSEEQGPFPGMKLTIHKQIMPGSGLGSSAASAAGAVFAANELLGLKLGVNELVKYAMFGEKLASGVKHADNITPCLMGGVTLIRAVHPLDIIPLSAPELFITVVHPQIEVKTSDAREILKKEVPLKQAIKQWGNVAGLVAGLMKGDHDLIGRSLEDVIIEPARSILIPGFEAVKKNCMQAGALGGGISGSGPSIFMLSADLEIAQRVEIEMKTIYSQIQVPHKTYVTKLNTKGISII